MAHAALLLVALLLVSDAMAGRSAQTRQATIVHEQDVAVSHARRRAPSSGHPPAVSRDASPHSSIERPTGNATRWRNTPPSRARSSAATRSSCRTCVAGMRPTVSFGRTRTKAVMDTTRLNGRRVSPGRTAVSARSGLSYPGRGAVARRRGEPAASRGDGPGHDLLDAAELLLQRRHLGPVLARLDLGEHRARCARQEAACRPGQPRGRRQLAALKERCSARCRSIGSQDLRDVAPYHYDWLHHPPEDPFWNFAELRNKYGRTRAAVLNLSGWHDDNYGPRARSPTISASSSRAAGNRPAPPSCLAPGSTALTRPPGRNPASAISVAPPPSTTTRSSSAGWIAICGTTAAPPVDAVRYFVMGDNQWRDVGTWPPRDTPASTTCPRAATRAGAGLSATPPTGHSAPSTFLSDPDDPVINPYESAGAHDYQALAHDATC